MEFHALGTGSPVDACSRYTPGLMTWDDFVWSFPVSPNLACVQLLSVFEHFAEYYVTQLERSRPDLLVVVVLDMMLIILMRRNAWSRRSSIASKASSSMSLLSSTFFGIFDRRRLVTFTSVGAIASTLWAIEKGVDFVAPRGVVLCDQRTSSSSSAQHPFFKSRRFFSPSIMILLDASA